MTSTLFSKSNGLILYLKTVSPLPISKEKHGIDTISNVAITMTFCKDLMSIYRLF